MKIRMAVTVATLFCACMDVGQAVTTTWQYGGNPTQWNDPLNWSAGVPTATTVAKLDFPAGDVVDITITNNAAAQGVIFGNNLTYPNQLYTIGVAKLTLGSGGLVNLWSSGLSMEAATIFSADCTITPGAGLALTNWNDLGTHTITVAPGGGLLQLGGPTTISVGSASNYGKIAGTGALQLTGALRFKFTTATGPGTWDFIDQTPSGSLTTVSLTGSYSGGLHNSGGGVWTGNYGGLDWTYTTSTGVLSAIPEPATWSLLAASLATIMGVCRRRSRA